MHLVRTGDIPPNACDAHIHVFDRRFTETLAADDISDGTATVDAYRSVRSAFGTTRTVVVTPRNYDVDNAVTLDAIFQLGKDNARGIATLRPDVSDSHLQYLHDGGIRGIRFTLYTPEQAPTAFHMIAPLAHRVHDLGWHVQLHLTAQQIVDHRDLLSRLPTPLVFDHLGRLPQPDPCAHLACRLITDWLGEGRAWVKLSAPYLDSQVGEQHAFSDVDQVARHWVRVAPGQLVWGSDWPHTSLSTGIDSTRLLAKLKEWTGSEAAFEQILVHNPARLYGFPL